MVEVFDEQDNNTGMTLTREPTFYILYKRKNEGIFKSSGEVPKKNGKLLEFFNGSREKAIAIALFPAKCKRHIGQANVLLLLFPVSYCLTLYTLYSVYTQN